MRTITGNPDADICTEFSFQGMPIYDDPSSRRADGKRTVHTHQQRFACHFTMLLAMVNSGWRVMIGGEREYSAADYVFKAGDWSGADLIPDEDILYMSDHQ